MADAVIEARWGNREIRFTGIEFLSPEHQPSQLIRSGDSLVMKLHYQAEKRIVPPHFGVEIYTDLGTKVTAMSTWAQNRHHFSFGDAG